MGYRAKAAFTALLVLAVFQLPSESSAAERTLIGYASPMTVRPGETVEIKVSVLGGPASYEADLVKIIHGDSISRYGDMFQMRDVNAPFSGTYSTAPQRLH